MCNRGTLDEVEAFDAYLGSLSHTAKIVIAGNHDWCFERTPKAARARMTNATYLEDEAVSFLGLKFYGSPWQPRFFDWAFNLDRGEPLRRKWRLIPEDTDVLITHGPPAGFGDTNIEGEATGCVDLTEAVQRIRPGLHVFGHIHEGYGQSTDGETTFVNGSSCDISYRPVNPPIVFDW
jgi:Icc-related predicted phosphoesterase